MNVKASLITLLVLLMALQESTVSGQLTPSLRSLSVEGIRNVAELFNPDPDVHISGLEVNYTFALTNVKSYGDKMHFKFWLETSEIAAWALGFSNSTPPHLAYMGPSEGPSGEYYCIQILSAEFPYKSEMVDGRTYYHYRVHVYYATSLTGRGTAYFGAGYEEVPTLQGSSLVRLKIKEVQRDGIVTFKSKTLHEDG